MRKKTIAVCLAAMLLVLVSACGKSNDPVIGDTASPDTATGSPTASGALVSPLPATPGASTLPPSASPAATLNGSAVPSLNPNATPDKTGKGDPAGDVLLSGDLKDFYTNATIIVIGKFTKAEGDINAARSLDDPSKVSEENKIMQKKYIFNVEECIKGNIKTGNMDFATTYETQMGWQKKPWKVNTFIEPKLNVTYVISLEKDRVVGYMNPNTSQDPNMFKVENDRMFIQTNDKDLIKSFEGGIAAEGKAGIPLSELRKLKD